MTGYPTPEQRARMTAAPGTPPTGPAGASSANMDIVSLTRELVTVTGAMSEAAAGLDRIITALRAEAEPARCGEECADEHVKAGRCEQAEAAARVRADRAELADQLTGANEENEQLTSEVQRLRAGEEPYEGEAIAPTPGQWITMWNQAAPEQRLAWAEAIMQDSARARDCFMMDHEPRLEQQRQDAAALARVRAVLDTWRMYTMGHQVMRLFSEVDRAIDGPAASPFPAVRFDPTERGPNWNPITGNRTEEEVEQDPPQFTGILGAAWRPDRVVTTDSTLTEAAVEAIRALDADPDGLNAGMIVKPYREHGKELWVFRCWGTDTCDGFLSLDHTTQSSAESARDRHLAEAHTEPTPKEG